LGFESLSYLDFAQANVYNKNIKYCVKEHIMVYSIDEIKIIVAPIAKKYQLPSVYLFGSYARRTASNNSDIDILIDRTNSKIKSLLDMGALYNDLSENLKKEIDIVTTASLEQPINKKRDADFGKNLYKERLKIYEG
jgi:predicted nucleotidyltransferase